MRAKQNELMTRVGPGTPCGEMLRRYWWPVAVSDHIGNSPVSVRLLGEDFVLFRDGQGRFGLLDRHCAHRRASLEFGRVEDRGLRCCYHGWLYDVDGRCLDQPCEPKDSRRKDRVRQPSYAVKLVSGFVFAYIGPQPAPLFPRYDLLFRDDCNKIVQGRDMHCNWLQRAENMLDALHVMCLHASVYPELALTRPDSLHWTETWYGCRMDLEYPNGIVDRHHHMFPAANRIQVCRVGQKPHQFIQFVVPVDDSRSISWQMWASEEEQGPYTLKAANYQHTTPGEFKRVDDDWWNIWERDQDDAACDSQGTICDRSKEHLATSDQGIVLFRRQVRRSIEAVKAGRDPVGVIREGDGQEGLIDLHAYKSRIGERREEVRAPEAGEKLGVVAPYDF